MNGKNLYPALALLFSLQLCSIMCTSQFINSGVMVSRAINFASNNVQAGGCFIARESISVTCMETFSGNGQLRAPVITIKADTFAFTGIIECGESCTIITRKPFDQRMFTREGTGAFLISVDPDLDLEPAAESTAREIKPIQPSMPRPVLFPRYRFPAHEKDQSDSPAA